MRGDTDQAECQELANLMGVRHKKKLNLPYDDSSENEPEPVRYRFKQAAIEDDKEPEEPDDSHDKRGKKLKKRRQRIRRTIRTKKKQ